MGTVIRTTADDVSGALPVYVRVSPVRPVGWWGRGLALGISLACFAVLGVAASVTPAAGGMGTHEQLGLPACGFVAFFGLPCPSCGYTTSFALFVRGRWLASFVNQPAGFTLALAAGCAAWGAFYVALTGRGLHRLFAKWVTPRRIATGGVLLVLAWGWKIALVKAWVG